MRLAMAGGWAVWNQKRAKMRAEARQDRAILKCPAASILKRPAASRSNWASWNAAKKAARVLFNQSVQAGFGQLRQAALRPTRRLRGKQSLREENARAAVRKYIEFKAELYSDPPPIRAARAAAFARSPTALRAHVAWAEAMAQAATASAQQAGGAEPLCV